MDKSVTVGMTMTNYSCHNEIYDIFFFFFFGGGFARVKGRYREMSRIGVGASCESHKESIKS